MMGLMKLKQTAEWEPVFLWFKLGPDPEQHPLQFTVWVPKNMDADGQSTLIARASGQVIKLLQTVQPLRPIIQGQYKERTDDN